jgi:hypothetical protein
VAKPVCDLCGQAFWDMERHRAKPHTPCPICGRSFVGFIHHRRRAHEMTDEQRQAFGYKIAQGLDRARAKEA